MHKDKKMEEKLESIIDKNGISNPIKKPGSKNTATKKRDWLTISFLSLGIVFIFGGVTCCLIGLLKPEEEVLAVDFPEIPSSIEKEEVYSALTGKVLSSPELKNAPTFCIQIPNGLDGARPQVGLTEAGVIFEAIAEAGITRFAAIFQNPLSAVIGPIRSLRVYYLDWDTPFGCAIVHAGGAADALAAVRAGGYLDLTENYNYMYRGTDYSRRWNNLFTTATNLKQFASDMGFSSSDLKGFPRLLPLEAERERIDRLVAEKLDILEEAKENTSEIIPEVGEINLRLGGATSFNVRYNYDASSNSYRRSYASGEAHEVYKCPDENLGEVNPEGSCNLVQMAPSVVIAMVVDEGRAADGYYESIRTTGSGKVYVFQNGLVIRGTWEKASRAEQIKFLDENGVEILLAPGQTFISAVPGYGSVEF